MRKSWEVVPLEYLEYIDVFRKKEGADILPPHRPYDHRIVLKEGSKLTVAPFGTSPIEQSPLWSAMHLGARNGWQLEVSGRLRMSQLRFSQGRLPSAAHFPNFWHTRHITLFREVRFDFSLPTCTNVRWRGTPDGA